MEFVKLFEPITINGLAIKNRIVMPAMGMAYTRDYSFTDRLRAFYRERARGGVGLMTVGPVAIDTRGSAPLMPGLFLEAQVAPIRMFTDELHRETDVKLATQLMHMGRYAFSFLTGETPIAPSPLASKLTGETPREMTEDDIRDVQAAYVQAARRARDAGFDYVEILACTGYLISQFLSPVTNQRTDRYGGTPENRMRFGLEVIGKTREALGDGFPMGIRIAGNDFMDGGNTNEEAARFAVRAEEAGADAINVTGGWHETQVPQLTTNVPPGCFVYLARGIRERVRVPVFASNRLGDPELAERTLRSGACDMVCWGRPLIADPDLPNKVREGRLQEIVSCIACNQGCFDSIFSGTHVSCVLNPRAGREEELRVMPSAAPRTVWVAGGGPAGMEFALTAAGAGHRVTLFEKEGTLGGQINLARMPPGKRELQKIVDSMRNRMELSGVKILLSTPLTPERVKAERPDVLAVATGARPMDLQVPGIHLPHVVQAWDVLMERVPDIGRNVVIIGGSATGCETAHFLAAMDAPDPAVFTFLMYHTAEDPASARKLLHASGRTVTVVEMVDRVAGNVGRTARWSLLKSLRLMGVSLRTGTRLVEITENEVVLETPAGQETLSADTVILAAGARSVDDLTLELAGISGIRVIPLGDAKEPRKLSDAVREGFEEALQI
jgi:2,4-dienoyl-CoA reductase (NADPH2)